MYFGILCLSLLMLQDLTQSQSYTRTGAFYTLVKAVITQKHTYTLMGSTFPEDADMQTAMSQGETVSRPISGQY